MNDEIREFVYLVVTDNGIVRVTATRVIFDEYGVKFHYKGDLVAFVTYRSLVYFIENKNE